jgi:hypothetical protein
MTKSKQKRDPQSRRVWQKRYREWKRSGLSQAEYCKKSGIYTDTFYNWSSYFRKAEQGRESGSTDQALNPFIAVNLSHETLPGELKIQCAGVTISYTGVPTAEQLGQWITALRQSLC